MNASEAADIISQIVVNAGRIKGADLARELRRRVPSWKPGDFAVANLREFVGRFVKSVHVSGRSGMDLWYEPLAEQGALREATGLDFWRIWASPKSPYALALTEREGNVKPITRDSSPAPGVFILEPSSTECHLQIARDFLRDNEVDSPTLTNAIDAVSPHWWQRWYSEIKKVGLASSWNEYRREKLEAELKKAISAIALSEGAAMNAIRQIVTDSWGKEAEKNSKDRSSDLRRAVIQAIERMSEEELRELRLPVGLVADAMRSRNA